MSRVNKTIIINVFLILSGCCISFTIIEFSLRLAGYQPVINENKSTVEGYYWVCDKELGFKNKPNGSYCSKDLITSPISTTDKYGFRNGYGWGYDNNSPIILIIGDSSTFCSEVNDDNTVPSEIAKLLSKEYDIRVLNGGVRGYNTVKAKIMLEKCMKLLPNIIMVVYVYCGNDYFENVIGDYRYPAKAPTVRWRDGALEIIEVNEPVVPWGESFIRDEVINEPYFTKRITNYMESSSVLLNQIFFSLRKIMNKNKLITIRDTYAKNIERANKMNAEEALTELLRQIHLICSQNGMVFLSTSFSNGLRLYRLIDYAAICKKAGIDYLDIDKNFVDIPTSYMVLRCDGAYDPHYGVKGTRTFAAAVVPTLKTILAERIRSGP